MQDVKLFRIENGEILKVVTEGFKNVSDYYFLTLDERDLSTPLTNETCIVAETGLFYVFDGIDWIEDGSIIGREGEQGVPGQKGDTGDGATIDIGTITTGNPGTDASATNSGTTSDAIFDFVIPRGNTGDDGASITSGIFVGDDLVFTKDDATTVIITDAKIDLKGEDGAPGTDGTDGISCNWQGAWLTGTLYLLQDIVENGGSSYICVEEHTSGTFATDLADLKWELCAQKGTDGTGVGDFMADGTVPMTDDLNMGGNDINNLNGVGNRILGTTVGNDITELDTTTYPSLTELSYVKGVTSGVQPQINALQPISYYAGTMTVNTGTLDAGTITDLQALGGTDVNISEASGSDPLRVTFDFTGITKMTLFTFFGYYAGGSGHQLSVEIYNHGTTNWDEIGIVGSETSKKWYSFPMFNSTAYMNSGAVSVRFRHIQTGNVTHDLILDYLEISYGGAGGQSGIEASSITFTPTGNISATNVASAIAELDTEKLAVDTTTLTYAREVICRARTTANITLSGTQTIDGIALVAGDYVLVANQSTGANNGIYIVNASTWTRAPEFDSTIEADKVDIFVVGGTTYYKTWWMCYTRNPTIGTTALVFTQMPGGIGTASDQASAGNHSHTALNFTGLASLGASVAYRYTSRTATASTGTTDLVVRFSGSTASQIETMPDGVAVANNSGRQITYVNNATVNWTIRQYASNTLDGSTSDFILIPGEYKTVYNIAVDTWITLASGRKDNTIDITVPAETYGSGWNGSNEVPTKNDVYDKIETAVFSIAGTPTGGDRITNIISLTTAEYTSATKDNATIYIITDA